jgi:hypothetical protein
MLPPKDNPPKRPAANDWRQRRGTSISLGSIGQSALRPNADGRPPLLGPRPTPQAAPQKPAVAAPPVSRAFMSGSLVPPRPMGRRPAAESQAPQPQAPRPQAPQTPRADTAAARSAPRPLPTNEPVPPQRADAPAAPRAAQPSPVPQAKSVARPAVAPARGIIAQPPASPAPEPKPEPRAESDVAAPASAPRRPAKTVRQFNAAMAADARGPAPARAPSLFNRRNGAIAAAALVVIAGGSTGAWFMTRPKAPSVTATPVTLAPPSVAVARTPNAEPTASTSAVTEAPSDAAAPAVIAERRAGPPANFGALAPRPAPGVSASRAGRVELAALPDAPDLGGSSAAEPAPEPAPPPAPAPVIRMPSPDEPFSTNPSNPDGGG